MASDEFSLHAWADESARTVGVPEPVYLLGAVVADPTTIDDPRDRMRALLTSGRKLHWREMDSGHRDQSMRSIAGFDAFHIVVVGAPMLPRKPERARAICLERLAWELGEQHHVDGLTLEARPQNLERRDRRTVDALRSTGALHRGIRVGHGLSSAEPMLWVADQVLGAVGEHLIGHDRWFTTIASMVEIVRVRA